MKPNVSSSSTFHWRGEEKKPSHTWRCGNGGDLRENPWRRRGGREFGEGDGKKRENGEKEDEDEVEVKECDK